MSPKTVVLPREAEMLRKLRAVLTSTKPVIEERFFPTFLRHAGEECPLEVVANIFISAVESCRAGQVPFVPKFVCMQASDFVSVLVGDREEANQMVLVEIKKYEDKLYYR